MKEISWTIEQNEITVCSYADVYTGDIQNRMTRCCINPNQKLELICKDTAADGWNANMPDSGITINGKKYCSGDFGSEEKHPEILLEGKKFCNYFL